MELIEENAAVLRSLGYDPNGETSPRLIDFSLVFPDEASRAAAMPLVSKLGFRWAETSDPVDHSWPEAKASGMIEVSALAITEAELALDQNLAVFGGRTDGWGFWKKTEH